MKLTENEVKMIKALANDYERWGHEENTDWYNMGFNKNAKVNKGVLASLVKKEIVNYYGWLPENKGCFNPIYKGKMWNDAIIEIVKMEIEG